MRKALVLLLAGVVIGSAGQKPEEKAAPKPEIDPVQTSVTVIGTRSPMEVDKSPVSTSVVGREELEQRNVRQVDQALTVVEGINTARSRGYGDGSTGVGLRGFSGRGSQGRTLVLLDGQPVNDSFNGAVSWSAYAVSEMERIEVARGPFSSLYGGNAMGGAINMITRPVTERQLEVFGQYGNREITNYSRRYGERFWKKLGLSGGYSRLQNGGLLDAGSTPGTGEPDGRDSRHGGAALAHHRGRHHLPGGPAGTELDQSGGAAGASRVCLFVEPLLFGAVHEAETRKRV